MGSGTFTIKRLDIYSECPQIVILQTFAGVATVPCHLRLIGFPFFFRVVFFVVSSPSHFGSLLNERLLFIQRILGLRP